MTDHPTSRVAVIGAGPAGLTAAYLLSKAGVSVTVLEADPQCVGGISRTVEYQGFRFDVGGDRFFSKSMAVEDLWNELLPDDMLERPRSSRIYYDGKFFSYPLRAAEALKNLGLLEATRCVLSYLKAQLAPVHDPHTFEDWVTNQFGRRFYEIFFKTYTEKVWGMSCREIPADWAAQRIQGLSLASAIKNAIFVTPERAPRTEVIKTQIASFRYPRLGPGMMWEACAEKTRHQGGTIELGKKVVRCEHDPSQGVWRVVYTDAEGRQGCVTCEHVISSAALGELMPALRPAPSRAVRALRYRDFLTVALILREKNRFTDNWIYIHDPHVKVSRVQNFKSCSPEMVPDPSLCSLGLEYFCFEGDRLWTADDDELIALAKRELNYLGLAEPSDVLEGCVVRQKKAYPVYDDHYAAHTETLRRELAERYPTFHPVGHLGMQKDNNQDHAMTTAMLTVKNILAGALLYDVWQVNQDAEYHEAGTAGARRPYERMVPTHVTAATQEHSPMAEAAA